ncbi:hypothetical protein CBM2631_A210007 [Cupriavidus taiwanensis]|nr:hypothetical protein CBM2617_A200014 [Cupriavidus taiwanensis]SOZ78799.1 hypothetical protein CBM2618_A180014 [Cupriavidus taiwanensis]SOZ79068.1 hypothetical protein CBM2622_A170013 [Cupriavidus taiwanensis]SPA13830.1 hypothetical protein CBM2631_A210007 [Cupriavidus taiwanensis]
MTKPAKRGTLIKTNSQGSQHGSTTHFRCYYRHRAHPLYFSGNLRQRSRLKPPRSTRAATRTPKAPPYAGLFHLPRCSCRCRKRLCRGAGASLCHPRHFAGIYMKNYSKTQARILAILQEAVLSGCLYRV